MYQTPLGLVPAALAMSTFVQYRKRNRCLLALKLGQPGREQDLTLAQLREFL
jgi:hypothetical protein